MSFVKLVSNLMLPQPTFPTTTVGKKKDGRMHETITNLQTITMRDGSHIYIYILFCLRWAVDDVYLPAQEFKGSSIIPLRGPYGPFKVIYKGI